MNKNHKMTCKECGSTDFYGVLESPEEEETPYCVDCDTQYISRPNIESMKRMMDYEFNYHLDFENWDDKEFVDFLKDLLDGKTEYFLNDKFPKETVKGFIGEQL